jgi:hypothetical protein
MYQSGIHHVVAACRMFILPYSPRWLVEKGRNDEAFAIVQRLHGTKDNEEFITLEFAEMSVLRLTPLHSVDGFSGKSKFDTSRKTIRHKYAHLKLSFLILLTGGQFSDLWSTKPMLRRTLTGMAVQICTQFTGINVSSYFQPTREWISFDVDSTEPLFFFCTVYAALGLSGSKILMITGINGALGAVVTIIFIYFFLDRVGRKSPLILGNLTPTNDRLN